jgi:hypothetical protein
MAVSVKMLHAPTGPSELSANSLEAPIVRRGDAALAGGEWSVGDIVSMRYSASAGAWQIVGLTSSDIVASVNNFYASNGGEQSFIASGTFTVPANVTLLKKVRIWGGGGGANTNAGAGGGAGASYAERTNIPVTPGQTITVTVGTGGAGGNGSPTAGGSGGTLGVSGGPGAGGLDISSTLAGGPGGAALFGGGSASPGYAVNGAGSSSVAPGGGGGGAAAISGGQMGAAGAAGMAIFEW